MTFASDRARLGLEPAQKQYFGAADLYSDPATHEERKMAVLVE